MDDFKNIKDEVCWDGNDKVLFEETNIMINLKNFKGTFCYLKVLYQVEVTEYTWNLFSNFRNKECGKIILHGHAVQKSEFLGV